MVNFNLANIYHGFLKVAGGSYAEAWVFKVFIRMDRKQPQEIRRTRDLGLQSTWRCADVQLL